MGLFWDMRLDCKDVRVNDLFIDILETYPTNRLLFFTHFSACTQLSTQGSGMCKLRFGSWFCSFPSLNTAGTSRTTSLSWMSLQRMRLMPVQRVKPSSLFPDGSVLSSSLASPQRRFLAFLKVGWRSNLERGWRTFQGMEAVHCTAHVSLPVGWEPQQLQNWHGACLLGNFATQGNVLLKLLFYVY